MNTWKLRTEILRMSHQWYWVMIFILVGSIVGWVSHHIWPSPFRATQDFYVGLNGYRSGEDHYAEEIAEQSFDLMDDYKNWQMSQLSYFAVSDSILKTTLKQLQFQDPYWDEISTQEFRQLTSVMWRNVGKWQLVIEMKDPDKAILAVDVWGDVIHDHVNRAVDHARTVVALDMQMSNIAGTRTKLELRQVELDYVLNRLLNWQGELDSGDQMIAPGDHWEILGLVSQAASWDPAWNGILNTAPQYGSELEIYQRWVGTVVSVIQSELDTLPQKITLLEDQMSKVAQEYELETAVSFGFSSTLVLEKYDDTPPSLEQVSYPGTSIIIGGIIGLFIWGVYFGFRISREKLT